MRIRFLKIIFLALLLGVASSINLFAQTSPPAKSPSVQSDWSKMTPEVLKAGIEQFHPAAYYILASKLFAEGKKDEAVFWFYAGQLRYRCYLKATPGLDPSGDPALFASLSETVGRPLNEYAFGDIPGLAKTIDAVLKWDEAHPNGFISKTAYAQPYAEIREGLVKLRDYALKNKEEIQRQRKANGLPNR